MSNKTPDPWDQAINAITIRDWFAGQALPAVMRSADEDQSFNFTRDLPDVARLCFLIADAMLAEREKSK